MEDKILIDLTGLNLTKDEVDKLQDHLKQQVVEFLKAGGEKPQTEMIAMGPGWIGIQAG